MENKQNIGSVKNSLLRNINANNQINSIYELIGELSNKVDTIKINTSKINSIEKQKYSYIKLLLYIVGLTIPFFALFILLNHFIGFGLSEDSIVLTFVGIAVTFVVVSNYMQVSDIKYEFDKRVDKIKEELTSLNNDKLNESLSNSNLLSARIFRDSKENNKNIELAFYYYQRAIVYCSKINNIDISFSNKIIREARIMLKKSDGNDIEPFVALINKSEYEDFYKAIVTLKNKDNIDIEHLEIIKNFALKVYEQNANNE